MADYDVFSPTNKDKFDNVITFACKCSLWLISSESVSWQLWDGKLVVKAAARIERTICYLPRMSSWAVLRSSDLPVLPTSCTMALSTLVSIKPRMKCDDDFVAEYRYLCLKQTITHLFLCWMCFWSDEFVRSILWTWITASTGATPKW